MQKITACLWFNDNAEEAVRFYAGIFKDAKIKGVTHYSEDAAKIAGRPKGSVLTVAFQLAGQDYLALNGGPIFKFTEAVSFIVNCETQAEVDRLWAQLSAGGSEGQCGWLKDKYGLSWQIVPSVLSEMLQDKDARKSERVMKALLRMTKLNLNELRKAYDGNFSSEP
jgi:predicted 3-demethylubiquinone-9 3-methyltransferase (glyoxalase superfamily)